MTATTRLRDLLKVEVPIIQAPMAGVSTPDARHAIAYDAGKALHAAAKAKGEFGFGAQWAGQGTPLSRPMPAADLVALLRSEMNAP